MKAKGEGAELLSVVIAKKLGRPVCVKCVLHSKQRLNAVFHSNDYIYLGMREHVQVWHRTLAGSHSLENALSGCKIRTIDSRRVYLPPERKKWI